MLYWPDKAPDEVLDYQISWVGALDSGDAISTSSWAITSGVGLTIDSSSNSTNTATVVLSDGVLHNSYVLTNTIVTVGGDTLQQEVTINVAPRASATTDFTLTARQAIEYAFRKNRELDAAESVTAADAAGAMTELNLMLKDWQKYPSLWRLTEGSFTLTAGVSSYTFSPQPHKVLDVRYYNGTSEYPITVLSRSEYYGLSSRDIAGTPTQVYVDYQRRASTLHVWQPLATVTTQAIRYTYQRRFEDIDTLDDDIDVRQEWLATVGYNLAARLADDSGRTGEVANRVIARSEQLLNEMLDDDRPEEVRFEPGYGYSW